MFSPDHKTTAVYIFRSSDKTHYTGITSNLCRRWREHLTGRCISTRHKRDLCLVYFKLFPNRHTAAAVERYIKNISANFFLHVALRRHITLR